ncbi:U3 small nucleolar RNA-associated protein 4 homolog isoform X1 [Kryptolebias marmoratus]|uniref:U3 small nucleolar RNA-associated protein 4 homolog isoform X1 n=1 Tax=Kryptolebias marmoratus TaxID=37003 RepID=UPI0018ACFCDD|nr:U3 small nucleolar RNA-associated protein 4 homolog isoform X1 [Kryptolebias marmoratus]
MGEFKVHRVRFFDYMPSAIRAVAFCRRTERLAAARADGSVEIFNFADNYFQEKVIPGRDGRAVEALCWVGRRLFSAGLDGEITEYDLENLRPRYSLEAYGGPVWTISSNKQGTLLAAGCEDGTVKMFEILEDRIQFQRNLDRQKGRIVSLSWHPSGAQIAAGMMDMIRIFDTETGHASHRLLVERGAGASKTQEVVVWSVAFLSDSTIISGDSAGKVQIWDGFTGTLVRTHLVTKWDVLVLSVSPDESSVIAGTSEGTVTQFQFISSAVEPLPGSDRQWVRTRTFKNHSHDVRALVHTDTAVVSGGMDTQLVVRPLLDKVEKNTQESALRKITFPHKNLVSCAKKAGLLLFQFPDHLEVWRLGDSDGNGKPGDILPVKRKPEKLIQLNRKGDDQICCSALSPCGGWLAYSTVCGVRLYRLQLDNNNICINKVSKVPKELCSAQQLCFSSDSSRFFASSSQSSVVVVGLQQLEWRHLQTLRPKSGSREPVNLLAPSEDGRWLVTANTDCEIHVFDLQKLKEVEVPERSTKPPVGSVVSVASCRVRTSRSDSFPVNQNLNLWLCSSTARSPSTPPVPLPSPSTPRAAASCPFTPTGRSWSSPWSRRSTRSGAGSCSSRAFTPCGCRGTRPSPPSPLTPETRRTSFCTTPSCSASSTRLCHFLMQRPICTTSWSSGAFLRPRGAGTATPSRSARASRTS